MNARLSLRRNSDAGFTLIELMVAIAILGFIMLPIASGFFVGVRSINDTSNRFKASTDAQLLSIYLPPDVESATSATTTSSGCTGLVGTAKLQLVNAASTYKIVYTLSTASPWTLTRYVCSTGAAATPIVVARNIKDNVASSLVVTITASPFQVSVKVTELATTTSPTNYVFTVNGRGRT